MGGTLGVGGTLGALGGGGATFGGVGGILGGGGAIFAGAFGGGGEGRGGDGITVALVETLPPKELVSPCITKR